MFRDHFAEHFADLELNDDDGEVEAMEVDRSTAVPSGSSISHVLGMKLLEGELLDDLVQLHARSDTPLLCFFPFFCLLSSRSCHGYLSWVSSTSVVTAWLPVTLPAHVRAYAQPRTCAGIHACTPWTSFSLTQLHASANNYPPIHLHTRAKVQARVHMHRRREWSR